jgi:hypothetical protein
MNRPRWLVSAAARGAPVLAASVTLAAAAVFIVDADDPLADFQTVQAAIDAASGLDTVFVRCGVYRENLVIAADGDGAPDLIGESPGCAILDGGGAGRVVLFLDVADTVGFTGFTIRNGRAPIGGGILLESSDPVISRSYIHSNTAVREAGRFGYGGGISALNSAPTLSNNLIVGNLAQFTGGGLDMYYSSPTVVNNTFIGNRAERPGAGSAYGGAVYALASSPTITSNLISQNQAEAGGGGIDLQNSSYAVAYNDLYQNAPAEWACASFAVPCPASFPFPPGNLSADPRVEGGPGGYCPLGDSPLRDAGPAAAPAATEDYFARPRLLDGDFDGVAVVDLGHCETDEVTGLALGPAGSVAWTAGAPGARYNLYRGLLSVLRSSCAALDCQFTQDPAVVAGARQDCDLASSSILDPAAPPPGDGFLYLATGEGLAEGSLGLGSDGAQRDNDHPCP